jgi:RNA polymerase-binding transcription factor DksA
MTSEERKRLFKNITDEIGLAKKHISVLKEEARLLLPENSVNRSSLREMIKTKSANERELRPALGRLNKLECALRKIDDTDFGTCYICEQPIPVARLIEMPGTSRCTKCEDK